MFLTPVEHPVLYEIHDLIQALRCEFLKAASEHSRDISRGSPWCIRRTVHTLDRHLAVEVVPRPDTRRGFLVVFLTPIGCLIRHPDRINRLTPNKVPEGSKYLAIRRGNLRVPDCRELTILDHHHASDVLDKVPTCRAIMLGPFSEPRVRAWWECRQVTIVENIPIILDDEQRGVCHLVQLELNRTRDVFELHFCLCCHGLLLAESKRKNPAGIDSGRVQGKSETKSHQGQST